MPQSPEFERFRFSFFEDRDSPRNGLDIKALTALARAERALAEDMLIRFLPDSRAIIGLGAMRSARARPQLQRIFETEIQAQRAAQQNKDSAWTPYDLVWSASALARLDPDPRYVEAIIGVLAAAPEWTERLEAAIELQHIRTPAVESALTRALDDPERLVRHHAARSLLAMRGLLVETLESSYMTYRVMSDDGERRAGGKRDILAAVASRPLSTRFGADGR